MPQVIPYFVGYAVSGTAYAGWTAFAVVVTSAVIPDYGKDELLRLARLEASALAGRSADANPTPTVVRA